MIFVRSILLKSRLKNGEKTPGLSISAASGGSRKKAQSIVSCDPVNPADDTVNDTVNPVNDTVNPTDDPVNPENGIVKSENDIVNGIVKSENGIVNVKDTVFIQCAG
jgi:hypothetical protein